MLNGMEMEIIISGIHSHNAGRQDRILYWNSIALAGAASQPCSIASSPYAYALACKNRGPLDDGVGKEGRKEGENSFGHRPSVPRVPEFPLLIRMKEGESKLRRHRV